MTSQVAISRRSSSRPRSVGEVERHALLVGVEPGEDAGPLPPVGLGEAQAGEQAGAVGPGRRLDVEDLGAEHRQHVGAHGPGPERGEVEDAQAVERQRAGGSAAVRPPRPRRCTGSCRSPSCSPSRGRRLGRCGAAGGRTGTGRSGSRKPSRGFATIDPRACEVVGRRGSSRRCRSARAGCGTPPASVEDLRGGALRHPRRDLGPQVGAVGEERAVLHPLGVVDHHAEVEPLLAGADARGRRGRRSVVSTPGRDDGPPAPEGPAHHVEVGHRVVGEAQHERLEHRHVDELARARRRSDRARETIVPMAAWAPVSHSPICPPTNTGARSGAPRPRPTIPPDQACSVNSVAGRSHHGPSRPNGVIVVTVRCGRGARGSPPAPASGRSARRDPARPHHRVGAVEQRRAPARGRRRRPGRRSRSASSTTGT